MPTGWCVPLLALGTARPLSGGSLQPCYGFHFVLVFHSLNVERKEGISRIGRHATPTMHRLLSVTSSRSCVKPRLVQFEKTRQEEGHMQPPSCLVVSNCSSVGLMQWGYVAMQQQVPHEHESKKKERSNERQETEEPSDRK